MAQINYQPEANYQLTVTSGQNIVHGSLTLFAYNFFESVSLNNFIVGMKQNGTGAKVTLSAGFYSLSGGTFNLVNSASSSTSNSSRMLLNFTSWSSTQNITPGTWYVGLVASSSVSSYRLYMNTISADQTFPNVYLGGLFTSSTLALPATIHTSNINTDSSSSMALSIPYILVTA